ncbi:MAG: hypothetical protein ACYDER_11605 [Ktedonobacteraceae bacterium]
MHSSAGVNSLTNPWQVATNVMGLPVIGQVDWTRLRLAKVEHIIAAQSVLFPCTEV